MDLFDNENNEMPQFSFQNDGGRPIRPYPNAPKFRCGDEVYLVVGSQREGPYVVASVSTAQKYTLSLANGQLVKDGTMVEEKSLIAVKLP